MSSTTFNYEKLDSVNDVTRYRVTSFSGREYTLYVHQETVRTIFRLDTGLSYPTAKEARKKLAEFHPEKSLGPVQIYAKGISVIQVCAPTKAETSFDTIVMLLAKLADSVNNKLAPEHA